MYTVAETNYDKPKFEKKINLRMDEISKNYAKNCQKCQKYLLKRNFRKKKTKNILHCLDDHF